MIAGKSFFQRLPWRRSTGGQSLPHGKAACPEGVRIYGIGDVHGCLGLLRSLERQIADDCRANPVQRPVIVLLGDLIDRGPDSRGVIEYLMAPPPIGIERRVLRGNHEQMALGVFANPPQIRGWCQLGGAETLHSYGVDFRSFLSAGDPAGIVEAWRQALPEPHLRWMEQLETMLVIGDYCFVHAGIRPGLALERQNLIDLLWIRDEFLGHQAHFGKVVVHGHTPVPEPDVRPNRINVDTGAYLTHCLTCVVLEGTSRRFLSARPK
jgi:serine/threonine protein phosphatase 1